MFKKIDVIFINAVNKTTIKEFKNVSAEDANLLVPIDGFIRMNGDWKVSQIIKEVQIPVVAMEGNKLIIRVYLNKITSNDYWLLSDR